VETLNQILISIALLGASALCVFLIIVLLRFNKFLQVLQSELLELNSKLKPVLENMNTITEKLRGVASKVDDQVNMIQGIFIAFKRVTDNVTRFEERFQQRLEEPLMRVGTLFGNIIGRVASFFTRSSQDFI
jgi:uncharacterized protein YoxC